jgi:UDP-3-O-[3-hydroxymyristoyl] glucosamine N-acyltransferase
VIDAGVTIGDECVLLPHAVIYRGARIGDRFFAHAHTVVREFCQIGNDVILQNGVVIGADGFGFARDSKGWHKIVQSGITILSDRVEVQANATVDRASMGETRIGAGTKIDNFVMIGHGCTVGENTMLCSQVGLAGSTRVGNNVILAGQVGVAGHLTIGDGAIATAQTGIPKRRARRRNRQRLSRHREQAVVARGRPCSTSLPELAKAIRKLTTENK